MGEIWDSDPPPGERSPDGKTRALGPGSSYALGSDLLKLLCASLQLINCLYLTGIIRTPNMNCLRGSGLAAEFCNDNRRSHRVELIWEVLWCSTHQAALISLGKWYLMKDRVSSLWIWEASGKKSRTAVRYNCLETINWCKRKLSEPWDSLCIHLGQRQPLTIATSQKPWWP